MSFITSHPELFKNKEATYNKFLEMYNSGELLSSIEDARIFLKEIDLRGIKIFEPTPEQPFRPLSRVILFTFFFYCAVKYYLF